MSEKDVEIAQRILEGRCPVCGHIEPSHSILCDKEEYNRLLKLKNKIAKTAIIDTLNEVKDKKNV